MLNSYTNMYTDTYIHMKVFARYIRNMCGRIYKKIYYCLSLN